MSSVVKFNCSGSDRSCCQWTFSDNCVIRAYMSPVILVSVSPRNLKEEARILLRVQPAKPTQESPAHSGQLLLGSVEPLLF